MMAEIRIAFDDNLGLPTGFVDRLGALLRASGAAQGAKALSFHDVGAMLEAFDRREVALAFAPAGSLPYLREPYEVVAEASFGPARDTVLRSVMRMRIGDAAASLAAIAATRLGCVNKYCTTSYWAPMILLDAQANAAGRPAALNFQEAAGFDDMLAAVVDGRSDAAMVWDAVAVRNPEATARTQALMTNDDLPCPLLLANESLPPTLRGAVAAFSTSYRSTNPADFFNGFTVPSAERITRFRDAMERARQTFGLAL